MLANSSLLNFSNIQFHNLCSVTGRTYEAGLTWFPWTNRTYYRINIWRYQIETFVTGCLIKAWTIYVTHPCLRPQLSFRMIFIRLVLITHCFLLNYIKKFKKWLNNNANLKACSNKMCSELHPKVFTCVNAC